MESPDYRLDGYEAASARVEDDFLSVTICDDMYLTLAAHHPPDERNSYLLFCDRVATWDVPGTAEYVGLRLERDVEARTFTFEVARRPTVPLGQNWLITQGCPPESIELDAALGPRPADALTSRLEDRLRANPEGRYTLLDDYTHNLTSFDEGAEVTTLLHDAHPDAAEKPYRLFLEETVPSFETYTVREGAFHSVEAANAWLDARDSPLPPAPGPSEKLGNRAAVARTRTTTGATPGPAPDVPTPPVPRTSVPRSRGGRS